MPEMRLRCARVAQTGAPERFELHAEALDAWLAVVMYSPQAEHIVHERDALAFQQVRETGASTPYEKECLLRDGTRIAIEIGLARLPGDDGQLLAIVLDVSARRRARNELELANRALAERTREAEAASEAKTRFLSSVSHELRTPVHTMLGYAGLMRRRSEGAAWRGATWRSSSAAACN